MGRGNAQERAAKIKLQLAAVAKAHADIAAQAVAAANSGIDSSIIEFLAKKAFEEEEQSIKNNDPTNSTNN